MFDFLSKVFCCSSEKEKAPVYSTQKRRRDNEPETTYPCTYCKKECPSQERLTMHINNYCKVRFGGSNNSDTTHARTEKTKSLPQIKAEDIDIKVTPPPNEKLPKSQTINPNMQYLSVGKSTEFLKPKKPTAAKPSSKNDLNDSRIDMMESTKVVTKTTNEFSEVDQLADTCKKLPLAQRRAKELDFINKNLQKESATKYIVSGTWISLYTKFLEKKIETPPGPIDNKVLSKKYPQDKTNTYKLNDKVWRFMMLMYGGGPPIWEGAPPNLIEVPSSSSRSPINLNNSLLNDSTMKLSDAKTADTMNRSTMADGMKSSYNEGLMSRSTPLAGRSKPSGLQNELNYCYLNAAAQSLVGLEQLCTYTAKEKYREHVTNKVPKFWKAFHELVSLCNSKASKLSPKQLRKLATNRFSAEEQHDSHEFIRYLLSGMQDEMNIPKPKRPVEFKDSNSAWEYYRKYNNSIIDELFAGQYISRVSCKSCGYISVAFDPFLDISLPIIPTKTKSIDDCLAMFTKEEEIKDSYTCEKCKSKGKVSRRLSISRYPKYLVIHLKRFQTYPKKKKLSDHITFPVDNLKIKRTQDHNSDVSYSLSGIVVHIGGVDSGHYVCFTKRGDEWFLCDDENVKRSSSKDVAAKEAYVLIYQKNL